MHDPVGIFPRCLVWEKYTVSPKNEATWCLIITLTDVDWFSKFFHQLIREKILYVLTQRCSPHLWYVATLPCESRKSNNVTDFDSILNTPLTCSWRHFEHLIWHLTAVRQTDCLKTADYEWLMNIWSLSDDVSDQQLNVVASWRFFHHDYLGTVFVLSTLYFVCCTHI